MNEKSPASPAAPAYYEARLETPFGEFIYYGRFARHTAAPGVIPDVLMWAQPGAHHTRIFIPREAITRNRDGSIKSYIYVEASLAQLEDIPKPENRKESP